MCDCPEVQKKRRGFSGGDYGELWIVHEKIQTYNGKSYVGGTWIPRQDQLQEMIISFRNDKFTREARVTVHDLFYHFTYREYPWKGRGGFHPTNIFDSQEQLWLAFVMYELHSKIWDGNVWKGESNESKK